MAKFLQIASMTGAIAAAVLIATTQAPLAHGGGAGGNGPDGRVIRHYDIGNPPKAKQKPATKPKPAGTKPKTTEPSKPKKSESAGPPPEKSLQEEKRAIEKDIKKTSATEKKLSNEMEEQAKSDKKLTKIITDKYNEIEDKKRAARLKFAEDDEKDGACCGGGKSTRQKLWSEMLEKIDRLDREFQRFYWNALDDPKNWGDPDKYKKYKELKDKKAEAGKKLRELNRDLKRVDKALERPLVEP